MPKRSRSAKKCSAPRKAVGNAFGLAAGAVVLGRVYLHRGDFDPAAPLLQRAFEICKSANLLLLFPFTASPLGACRLGLGRNEEALPLLEQAVDKAAAMHRMVEYSHYVFWLSQGLLGNGDLDRAAEVAERALALALTHKERGSQAWTLRLLGDIAFKRGQGAFEEAQDRYSQSLALAGELGMRPLQARCRLALGTMHGLAGRKDEARAELSASIELANAMQMRFFSRTGAICAQ